jgi:hypothetical protein
LNKKKGIKLFNISNLFKKFSLKILFLLKQKIRVANSMVEYSAFKCD